ncbi:MAG TPA: hypothetical protein VFI54_23950 [Solirubrobacteraceae bacterium]|nr:hypothetical protein [Solirubrobacteraceae bacterium]
MTELSINRSVEPRTWALQEGYRLLAYLQLGRSGANSGEVRRDDEVWQISSRRRRPEEVVLGEAADPIVVFDRDQATLRGLPEPLPWTFSGRLSRSRAVLGGGDQAITLETAGWRPQATVEVQGEWEHRDLVVLACFFAAIARRRRSTFVGSAVPGS